MHTNSSLFSKTNTVFHFLLLKISKQIYIYLSYNTEQSN